MKLKIQYVPLFLFFVFSQTLLAQSKLTTYVNPFIGTGRQGHTFPGAVVPFGMVQLSPDNGKEGSDWSSGYHYSDDVIAGFSHLHLSGTDDGDGLDISVMPLLSPLSGDEELIPVNFNHRNEKASPGYYSVQLDNGIAVELTATERLGYHRYHFPVGAKPTIRFDLAFHRNSDIPTETFIKKIDDSTLVGYRYSTGLLPLQRIYFAARTTKPMKNFTLKDELQIETGDIALGLSSHENGRGVAAQLIFEETAVDETIEMKVALSMSSMEKALTALQEEAVWDFNAVQRQADQKWEDELEKVQIKTSDENLKQIFYTALYHTAIAPIMSSDADEPAINYIPYSLEAPYKTLYPLLMFTQPERYTGILNSLMSMASDSTDNERTAPRMDATIPILADAVMKNWSGIDKEKAYEVMKKKALKRSGAAMYIRNGYVPQDKIDQSALLTLAYGYHDYCLAEVAKKMGKLIDFELFSKRSAAYKHIFDAKTGHIRARNNDGSWANFTDPSEYAFFVPHDPLGLSSLYGNQGLEPQLDSLFADHAPLAKASIEGTEMIGNYNHARHVNRHVAYMYSFLGKPWKTQRWIRQLVDSMYHARPDGYVGHDNAGEISAWAVWSVIGLYPLNPVSGEYVIGSPAVDAATLQLEGGKEFRIITQNNSPKNTYIQSVTFNSKPYRKLYVDYQDVMKGGEMVFHMGAEPNMDLGKGEEFWPTSVPLTQTDEVDEETKEKSKSVLDKVKDIFKNL